MSNQTTEVIGRLTYGLHDYGTSLQISASGTGAPGVAYFYNGAGSFVWNDVSNPSLVNWSLDNAGTVDAGNVPGPVTDVILSASNLQALSYSTSLGGNTTINSLNVITTASNTIVNDGSALTINALQDSNTDYNNNYNGNPAGNGISIASGAGPLTINVPVTLGAYSSQQSQTWTNNSGSGLTVTGNVQGTATLGGTQTLTLTNNYAGGTTISGVIGNGAQGGMLAVVVNNNYGAGVTVLSASNSYTGGTTLTAGSLTLGNSAALSTGPVTVNGGQLDLAGFSPSFYTLNGAGGVITNNGAAAATLTLVGGGNYAGSINDGSEPIALVKTGGGTMILSGNNVYSGSTTVSAGNLQIAGALGPGGTYSSNIFIAGPGTSVAQLWCNSPTSRPSAASSAAAAF